MDTLTAAIGDYQTFLQTIMQKVAAEGFDLRDFVQLDHMGYRVPSLEQYQEKKRQMAQIGTQIGETMVNDRPIAIFRLHTPIIHDTWRIDALELLAPKPGKSTEEGLDHIEFVLYDDKETFLKKYADKPFDLDSADRGINPEIKYRFSPNMSVKFHLLNLPTVIYLQDKLGITEVRG